MDLIYCYKHTFTFSTVYIHLRYKQLCLLGYLPRWAFWHNFVWNCPFKSKNKNICVLSDAAFWARTSDVGAHKTSYTARVRKDYFFPVISEIWSHTRVIYSRCRGLVHHKCSQRLKVYCSTYFFSSEFNVKTDNSMCNFVLCWNGKWLTNTPQSFCTASCQE